MRRALAIAGALLAGLPPFVITYRAWPEVVAASYFLARGGQLYDTISLPYTPWLFLTLGGLGKLFPWTPELTRAVAALAMAPTGALLVVGLRRRGRLAPVVGLLLAVPLYVLWMHYLHGISLCYALGLSPLLLAGVLCLERFEAGGRDAFLIAGGLLLGSGVLAKQTACWAALGALAWLALRSRRRSLRGLLIASACIAAPYLATALVWCAVRGDLAFIRWTFVIPVLTDAASAFSDPVRAADLYECVAPFLAFPALWLLQRALPIARPLRSPAAWVAIAAAGMAWPRWGLLHLSPAAALIALCAGRAVLALVCAGRRFRRTSAARAHMLSLAAGAALLLSHTLVAAVGAGGHFRDALGGPTWYWDDPRTQMFARAVRAAIPEGGAFFNFQGSWESLYAITSTTTPDGAYAHPGLWWWNIHDGVDQRMARSLERPGTRILYREPTGLDRPLRDTDTWRFIAARTRVIETLPEGVEWREVVPPPPSTSAR